MPGRLPALRRTQSTICCEPITTASSVRQAGRSMEVADALHRMSEAIGQGNFAEVRPEGLNLK